jgi:hypothetical protein
LTLKHTEALTARGHALPRQFLLVEAGDRLGQPIAVVHSAPDLGVALVEARRLSGAPEHGGYLVEGCIACEITPHLEPLDGCTATVLIHESGCTRLAGMLAQAGVAR